VFRNSEDALEGRIILVPRLQRGDTAANDSRRETSGIVSRFTANLKS
jgi:hypothetical protein